MVIRAMPYCLHSLRALPSTVLHLRNYIVPTPPGARCFLLAFAAAQ
jgi:hypothetical protein